MIHYNLSKKQLRELGNNRVNARCPNRQSRLTVKGKAHLFLRLNPVKNVE